MDEMTSDFESFEINYQRIVNQKDMLAITRILAQSLMIDPYMNVGEFFKNLSDHDLTTLLNLMENEEDEHYSELMLITEMLAAAEGVMDRTLDKITERFNMLTVMLVCESLARKGLVKVHHHNMSFGDDAKDKMIVEKV